MDTSVVPITFITSFCGLVMLPLLGGEKTHATLLSGIGTYHEGRTNWKDAKNYCRVRGRKLLTIDDVEYWDKLTEQLNVTDTDPVIWVGGRGNKEDWLWSHDMTQLLAPPLGCFSMRFNHGATFVFTNNQPTLCVSFCQHHVSRPYAGLKDSKCYCLRDQKTFRSVLDETCNSTCPGNRYQFCGGDDSATVYDTRGSLRWHMHKPDEEPSRQDCGQVLKTEDNRTMWYSGDCHQKLKYICKIVNNPGLCSFYRRDIPCYYASGDAHTWFEAAKICKEMNGHLADRNIEQADDILRKNTFYWTGLTRISQTWIGGGRSIVDPSIPRSRRMDNKTRTCLVMRNDKLTGAWSLTSLSCKDHLLPFICRNVKNSLLSVEYTYRDDFVTGPQKQVVNNDHLFGMFYIVIPAAAGTFVLTATLLIVCIIHRWNAKQTQKRTEEEHFYFVLEKESVYNTIDGVDMLKEPSFRMNTASQDNARTSRVSPKLDTAVMDHPYNELDFKRRLSSSVASSVIVHNAGEGEEGEEGEEDHPYDLVRAVSEYDTIENIRSNCRTLVDQPYDQCGKFTRKDQDINFNQNSVRSKT